MTNNNHPTSVLNSEFDPTHSKTLDLLTQDNLIRLILCSNTETYTHSKVDILTELNILFQNKIIKKPIVRSEIQSILLQPYYRKKLIKGIWHYALPNSCHGCGMQGFGTECQKCTYPFHSSCIKAHSC